MANLKNDRYLRALFRQPVDRTPIWIMRQAGRYLPEYRKLREKVGDFMTLCKTPELACEATLQPLKRYPLDAAILFSDILVIPEAMGLALQFTKNEGPSFSQPISSEKDIDQLIIPEPESALKYVMDTIHLTRHEIADAVPLIGFSGSPWTLATYMVEGGSSKHFSKIKQMMYSDPRLLQKLLSKLTESIILYLNAQIRAGVQSIMIFDTWGGVLTESAYRQFSLDYMVQIINGLLREYQGQRIPVTLFTKGGGQWLEMIAETDCDAIGLDWTVNLNRARHRVAGLALQGNMDPSILYAPVERIEQEVINILQSFGYGSGHVFNLGHGIYPDTPPEHVAAFIEAVRNHSPIYHHEHGR